MWYQKHIRKGKVDKFWLHQNSKLLCIKGHCQESERIPAEEEEIFADHLFYLNIQNTHTHMCVYIYPEYIYIYICMCVCVCVCVYKTPTTQQLKYKQPNSRYGQSTWTDISPGKVNRWPVKHMQRCSILVIRQMQIKTTVRCHFTPSWMALAIQKYHLLCIYPKELKTGTHILIPRYLYPDVDRSIIHSSQKVGTTWVFTRRWMDKWNMIHAYNGVFSLTK